MRVFCGVWRDLPKETRLQMLMAVVAFQANKRRLQKEKAAECGNTATA
jgi:hypothetical protein